MLEPTLQGSRKDEGERVLEDINLFLIGGSESRSFHLGVAQVREAEGSKPDIPPIAVLPKCWLWGKCIELNIRQINEY